MVLDPAQREALDHVRAYASKRRSAAQETVEHILEMSDIACSDWQRGLAVLRAKARVGLQFHPDRLLAGGTTVVESLLKSGFYRSQFETGVSSGSLTAYQGGPRDLWEVEMFGEIYQNCAGERPKYGALDLLQHPDGPCPRFGSCYFLLSQEVSRRCSFTFGDSHRCPVHRGTLEEFEDLSSALLTESFERNFALGEGDLPPADLLARILELEKPRSALGDRPPGRNLDHYLEAQVHGPISLKEDVELLVADPSFLGTPTEDHLRALSQNFGIELSWHQGFKLHPEDTPRNFRGPSMPALAQRVGSPLVTAHSIGKAARSVIETPETWVDLGTQEHLLQQLKRLWHVVVKFG